jgi:hypothetical protein
MVGRKRRPRPAGQIEHLDRVFDAKTDIEDFAAERFGALKTGDWGIRRYLVPPDSRPVFVVLRASDEVQFKGRRVPFHNQLDDITRAMAYRPVKRCVAAVFWDCESARDFRGTGTARRAIERQGFATGLAEAGSPARPCEEIWFWHSDRQARG